MDYDIEELAEPWLFDDGYWGRIPSMDTTHILWAKEDGRRAAVPMSRGTSDQRECVEMALGRARKMMALVN